jgi:hypothetical protein
MAKPKSTPNRSNVPPRPSTTKARPKPGLSLSRRVAARRAPKPNPNTPTFSFVGSTYTSPYLAFTPVELEDRAGKPLQTPTADEAKLMQTYDAAPYTRGQTGAIPFIDLGGRYLVSGTEYDGSGLSGKSFATALADITAGANPTSRAAQAVAAHLVGAICSLTNNQPASVCAAVPSSLKTGPAASTNQGASSGG